MALRTRNLNLLDEESQQHVCWSQVRHACHEINTAGDVITFLGAKLEDVGSLTVGSKLMKEALQDAGIHSTKKVARKYLNFLISGNPDKKLEDDSYRIECVCEAITIECNKEIKRLAIRNRVELARSLDKDKDEGKEAEQGAVSSSYEKEAHMVDQANKADKADEGTAFMNEGEEEDKGSDFIEANEADDEADTADEAAGEAAGEANEANEADAGTDDAFIEEGTKKGEKADRGADFVLEASQANGAEEEADAVDQDGGEKGGGSGGSGNDGSVGGGNGGGECDDGDGGGSGGDGCGGDVGGFTDGTIGTEEEAEEKITYVGLQPKDFVNGNDDPVNVLRRQMSKFSFAFIVGVMLEMIKSADTSKMIDEEMRRTGHVYPCSIYLRGKALIKGGSEDLSEFNKKVVRRRMDNAFSALRLAPLAASLIRAAAMSKVGITFEKGENGLTYPAIELTEVDCDSSTEWRDEVIKYILTANIVFCNHITNDCPADQWIHLKAMVLVVLYVMRSAPLEVEAALGDHSKFTAVLETHKNYVSKMLASHGDAELFMGKVMVDPVTYDAVVFALVKQEFKSFAERLEHKMQSVLTEVEQLKCKGVTKEEFAQVERKYEALRLAMDRSSASMERSSVSVAAMLQEQSHRAEKAIAELKAEHEQRLVCAEAELLDHGRRLGTVERKALENQAAIHKIECAQSLQSRKHKALANRVSQVEKWPAEFKKEYNARQERWLQRLRDLDEENGKRKQEVAAFQAKMLRELDKAREKQKTALERTSCLEKRAETNEKKQVNIEAMAQNAVAKAKTATAEAGKAKAVANEASVQADQTAKIAKASMDFSVEALNRSAACYKNLQALHTYCQDLSSQMFAGFEGIGRDVYALDDNIETLRAQCREDFARVARDIKKLDVDAATMAIMLKFVDDQFNAHAALLGALPINSPIGRVAPIVEAEPNAQQVDAPYESISVPWF